MTKLKRLRKLPTGYGESLPFVASDQLALVCICHCRPKLYTVCNVTVNTAHDKQWLEKKAHECNRWYKQTGFKGFEFKIMSAKTLIEKGKTW